LERVAVTAGNRLRRNNEKLLLILLKLARVLGGFGKLKEYGVSDEEINFLKDEFNSGNNGSE
jgi:hypothetical protein